VLYYDAAVEKSKTRTIRHVLLEYVKAVGVDPLPGRDVNKATGVKARDMQGQGHRPKVKVKNTKVHFRVNATVNAVCQF